MKEPWKKTCNGKVIITLNDEKTVPTEVEVPVDLNWTNRSEKKCSAPKAIILVGVVLLLGLTVVTLFKIQNLVYSTSYINWRMQELESAVSDSNDDVKLIKYKLSLDEREDEIAAAKVARAEPLIASIENSKNVEQLNSQDLKLSESQNRKLTTNSLTSESKEPKNTKEAEVQNTNKGVDAKPVPTESTNDKISETTDLNDGRDHPNPADPAEWIKPLVETFDIFGNQPIEDHFIQNVLMKLLMPENNFEVLEFNKMQEASNAAYQEAENQKMMLTPILRNNKEKQIKPLPPAIENMMKSLLPSVSNFKILHFNERPETIQQNNMEEEMVPKMAFQNMKIKQVLPPIEGIVKSLLPPNNMKIFQFNDKVQEQNSEEDMPKITIQSIKLKLLPLPPQEDFSGRRDSPANNMNNIEVIHLNEQPEPSQEVEAPKMPMPNFNPFPFPLQDILMKTILPASKNIEIVPLNEKPEEQHMMHQQPQQQPQDIDMGMHQQEQKFNPLPIPIQDLVMKTLMPPPSQNAESHYNGDSQEQSNQEVEVQKIPIRTIKITPFPLPIPEALMKSMLPMNNYGESINMNESHEEIQQQEQQQQQQQQMLPQPQQPVPQEHQMPPEPQQPVPQEQQMPPEPQQPVPQEQQMPPHPQQEVPRPIVRSTKLNPVGAVWNMAPPPQYSNEPVEN